MGGQWEVMPVQSVCWLLGDGLASSPRLEAQLMLRLSVLCVRRPSEHPAGGEVGGPPIPHLLEPLSRWCMSSHDGQPAARCTSSEP